MNPILSDLGVPMEVQDFFDDSMSMDSEDRLVFSYGKTDSEYYNEDLHLIPITENIWLGGYQNYRIAKYLFFCSSAVEAIAFLSSNFQFYQSIDQFAFISLGLLPNEAHFEVIRQVVKRKRFGLVMGNDLLGRICDIKIAAGIYGHTVVARLLDQDRVSIKFRNKEYQFLSDTLTLNAFEKTSKFRSYAKTFKPKNDQTFLAQTIGRQMNQ